MNSEQVCFYNAIAYSLIFIYNLFKNKISLGLIVWGIFTASAWCTFIFIQQPMYPTTVHYSEQQLFAYIYLLVIIYLFISPLFQVKPLAKDQIIITHYDFIKKYMIFLIIFQTLSILVDLTALKDVLSLNQQNVTAYKDFSYEETTNIPAYNVPILAQVKGWILAPLSNFNIALALLMYFCWKKDRKIVQLFTITTILDSLINVLIAVSRGQTFFLILYCAIILFFLYNNINQRQKRLLSIVAITIAIVIVPFMIVISLGRFGKFDFSFFIYKYFGEAMNNFNGLLFYDIKGYTNGNAYLLSYINSLLGISPFETTMEKWEYIERVTKGISGQYFYTFVGGLVIEFGKIITLFIAIIFNFYLKKATHSSSQHNIGYYILLTLISLFFIKGAFLFPLQGRDAILTIIALIFFIHYFKVKKNNKQYYN